MSDGPLLGSIRATGGPAGNDPDQVERGDDVEIGADEVVARPELAGDIGDHDLLCRPSGELCHQLAEQLGSSDLRDLFHVRDGRDGSQVRIAPPVAESRRRRAEGQLREPTAIDERLVRSSELSGRQWQQLDDADAPRQGLRDAPHREESGRPGEHELPAPAVGIEPHLERQQETVTASLELVDRRTSGNGVDVTDRIGADGLEDAGVVEVPPARGRAAVAGPRCSCPTGADR